MNIVGHRNVRKLIETRVQRNPGKTFLIFEAADGEVKSFTYGEFDRSINKVANGLIDLGVKKGDKFNIHLPNGSEFLFLWFAAAKIGAVMVPTNTLSTGDEMEYILNHSESVAVFTTSSYFDTIESIRDKCPRVRSVVLCGTDQRSGDALLLNEFLRSASAELRDFPLVPEDENAMIYTSGTTARPKGVLITHANYVFVGEVMSKAVRLQPEDRHFVVLPLFHGNAQYYSTMPTLSVGASMVLAERFSASRWAEQAARHQATVASLFAAPIRMILNQPPTPSDGHNHLRVALFAQCVTDEQLVEFETRFGTKLLQLYGMTETIGTPTINPIDDVVKNQSIGLPALGYEVKVVDEQGRELPVGQVGQLIVRGEPSYSLMKGYFKNPEATSQTMKEGWLHTGDNSSCDADGYFYFVDRAKDMIKRAGENVAAGEVERVINDHSKVFESAAIGVPDEIRDEAIKVFVVLKEGQTATPEEIIDHCAQRMAKFRVPSFIEFRQSLPRTSVGKIQKHILRNEEAEKRGS